MLQVRVVPARSIFPVVLFTIGAQRGRSVESSSTAQIRSGPVAMSMSFDPSSTAGMGDFLSGIAATRGKTSLVAEATYEDATILLGPAGWYGKKELTLNFPGNLPPDASLYATPQTNEGKKFFVHIEAAVSDADGAADISGISLVLTDAKGRLLKRWTQADFEQSDAFTWEFQRAYKVSGSSPWTLTLTATDSAGQSVSRSVVITR